MSNKSIKQLMVKVNTEGADSAVKELKTLNTTLEEAAVSSKALATELLSSSKYLGHAATAYQNINKAIEGSVASVRKLNTAMNGDTAKSLKGLNAYIENLQLLDIYLKDVGANALAASKSLSQVVPQSSISDIDRLVELMEGLIDSVGSVDANLEELNDTMRRVEGSSLDVAEGIEKVGDYITDLDVTTNRGNETLEELGHTLGRTGRAADRTGRAASNLNNRLKNLNGTGSQSARAFSKLAFDMNPLTSAYASIAINVYATTEAFRFLKEAAALDRLIQQTAQFSASISGVNVKALATQLQEVSGGALAMGEALKQSVRGISFNFMTEDLIRLTEGARKASVALGLDFTDAMDRVIRGISKGEVELLDELGVVTRLDTAYQKFAATLGLKADQLTDYQRKVALTNEVLDQLETKYKAFDVAANSTERLGTATKNLVDSLLMGSSRTLDSYISKLATLVESISKQASASKNAAESLKIYNDALEAGNIDQARVAWYEYLQLQKQVSQEHIAGSEAFNRVNEAAIAAKEAIDLVTVGLVAMVAWWNKALIMTAVAKTFAGIVLAGKAAAAAISVFVFGLQIGAGVVGAAAGAFTAMKLVLVAALGPVWAVVAGVAAVTAGVLALLKWLAPETFGSVVSFATDALGSLVDSLKDLALWVGDKVGLSDFVADLLGVENAADKAARATKALAASRSRDSVKSNEIDHWKAGRSPEVPVQRDQALEAAKAEAQKGLANQAYATGLADAVSKTKEIATQMGVSKNRLQELALAANEFRAPTSLEKGLINEATVAEAKKVFEELQEAGLIAKTALFDGGSGLLHFAESAKSAGDALAALNESRAVSEAVFATSVMGSENEGIKTLEHQIKLDKQRLDTYKNLGSAIDSAERAQIQNNIEINREKIKQLELSNKLLAIDRSLELEGEISVNNLKLRAAMESEIISEKIRLLEEEIRLKAKLGQDVGPQKHKLALLEEESRYVKGTESAQRAEFERDKTLSSLSKGVDQSLNNRERVANLQKELDYKKEMIASSTTMNALEKERANFALSNEQDSLNGSTKAAAFFDVSDVSGSIAQLPGLSDLQAQFATSVSSMSETYGNFLADMEGSGKTFTEYLSGNVEAMSQVMQASVGIAGQIFQTLSAEKIAGIDREIEAEKRRDGKSAESLAKIKALEAKKIKEETKAKKASVIMSTAAGVMQAFAQMGPFGAPFAAAIAAMGMMQLSSIDKAANGQLASLNDGGGTSLSITGGSRSNEIDVSKKANAGELAYLQGMSGTGTANNFTPGKSVGGYARAGTSITVGESGPETITPAMPVNVTPAGSSGGGFSLVFSPVTNATAVDSAGMEDLLHRYSKHLFESLEKELNARNRSLDSL